MSNGLPPPESSFDFWKLGGSSGSAGGEDADGEGEEGKEVARVVGIVVSIAIPPVLEAEGVGVEVRDAVRVSVSSGIVVVRVDVAGCCL
jgi:hypothetical protein